MWITRYHTITVATKTVSTKTRAIKTRATKTIATETGAIEKVSRFNYWLFINFQGG
ncbi:hypothetical protein NBRC116591_15410 [Sessilibacter corallicola]|uniref:Uncharacterized protein n=1 Tax=Sessilibacter corallicola TaxID=2904075 RepID=A0ABQ0A7Y0_9GAMM